MRLKWKARAFRQNFLKNNLTLLSLSSKHWFWYSIIVPDLKMQKQDTDRKTTNDQCPKITPSISVSKFRSYWDGFGKVYHPEPPFAQKKELKDFTELINI